MIHVDVPEECQGCEHFFAVTEKTSHYNERQEVDSTNYFIHCMHEEVCWKMKEKEGK